jgi:hypothetical protein
MNARRVDCKAGERKRLGKSKHVIYSNLRHCLTFALSENDIMEIDIEESLAEFSVRFILYLQPLFPPISVL